MYSYLVDDNSEHKKSGVNRNIVATISHNKYKYVLLNKKCLRHSMNRIQSKDYRIGNYEINKISLSHFDDKIYIQHTFSSQNNFFVILFAWHIKFKKRKALEKELSEELTPVVWHPNRWWDWCMSEDEEKEIDPMFIEEL